MANSATNMTTQLYSDMVLKGFVDYMAPLNIFSLDASPAPAERGNVVTVPFIESGSAAAADWSEATGYAAQANQRIGKQVTINKHKFVFSGLTDTEVANSSITNLEQMAYNQGATLATAVLTDIFTAFTGSNFTNIKNLTSASAWTVDELVNLRADVSALKWPEVSRNVILESVPVKGLLKDDDLKYIYRGSTEVVTQAVLANIFGWQRIFENNLLPALNSGVGLVGVACHRDALIIANRYLAPQVGNKYSMAVPITDPGTGLTIGVREWYDENYGSRRMVWECSYGFALGNPNAAVLLTATAPTL